MTDVPTPTPAPDAPPATPAEVAALPFDKALEALRLRDTEESDDIAALERTLAPSLESGFMLLDPAGAVLSVNDLGADLLGID